MPLRVAAVTVLLAAISVPIGTSAADPLEDRTRQLESAHRPLTPAEWCELALLTMAHQYTNVQTRMALNEMARNRGCYEAPRTQAQLSTQAESSSTDEQVRIAVCRTVAELLSQPDITTPQKLAVMKIARDNACIK